MTLTIGSLCSGYGGLDLAVESVLDARTVWVSDIDKGACKVLAHRFPHAPNLGDMTAVDWSAVEPVDVLTGGTPCQDLSHAGKRAGMTEGTRSNLWVMMREAIAQLRPRLVIWENVGGAYSAEADSDLVRQPRLLAGTRRRDGEPVLRALGRVLGDLASLGYVGGWHGLRAADVGAPHGRLRVFVVAWPAPDADGRFDLSSGARSDQRPVPGCDEGSPAAALRARTDGVGGSDRRDGRSATLDGLVGPLLPSPRTSDTNGPGHHGDGGLDLRTAVTLMPTPRATDGTKGGPNQRGSSGDLMLPSAVALLPTPAVNDMGRAYTPETWDEWCATQQAKHGNGNGHGKSLAIEAQRLVYDESRCVECGCPEHLHDEGGFCAGRCGGEMCGGRQYVARLLPTPTTEPLTGNGHARHLGGEVKPDRWGDYAAAIARWEHVTGRPAPPPTQTSTKGNPQLSPRFTEWMMGLPHGWITDTPNITRNEALKLCGNGVVPQQAAAAIRFILANVSEVAA